MNSEDRYKTGCVGIILPLLVAAYGVRRILHPRQFNRLTGLWDEGAGVVGLGISALGVAIFVHGLCFVPYRRIRFLRSTVAAIGIALFLLGLLFWRELAR